MKSRVLILCPYPKDEAPSQRFRFEQYIPFLEKNGFQITQKSFLSLSAWRNLYKPGNHLAKLFHIIAGFSRRKLLLLSISKYDFIFIHREASPLGPPFFEWMIAKIFRKKIIYDFDDAIWLENTSQQNRLARQLKNHGKVKFICKWAWKVSTGNNFLAAYAKQFNDAVKVIPTTLVPADRIKSHSKQNPIIIGWTGTHSTLKYIESIFPVFDTLFEKRQDFKLQIICNQKTKLDRPYLDFKPWDKTSEVDDLLAFDLGVMPLFDTKWEKGKCGFKALQYMNLGIPCIASPVGVNVDIIKNDVNGFLADTEAEWLSALTRLMDDAEKRTEIAHEGLATVKENYSTNSQQNHYLQLFQA